MRIVFSFERKFRNNYLVLKEEWITWPLSLNVSLLLDANMIKIMRKIRWMLDREWLQSHVNWRKRLALTWCICENNCHFSSIKKFKIHIEVLFKKKNTCRCFKINLGISKKLQNETISLLPLYHTHTLVWEQKRYNTRVHRQTYTNN